MNKKHAAKQAELNRQSEADRVQLYRVLSGLGVLNEMRQDKWLKRTMLSHRFRRPTAVLSADLRSRFSPMVGRYFDAPFHGLKMIDVIQYAMPLFFLVGEDKFVTKDMRETCRRLETELWEAEVAALRELGKEAIAASSLTAGYVSIDRSIDKNFVLTVERMAPETTRTMGRGGFRTIHRVYSFMSGSVPQPVSASFPGHPGTHPVYLQEHAVRRMQERLDEPLFHPMIPGLVGRCLQELTPVFYRGRWLFPVQIKQKYKLGYLVGEKTAEGIICPTFLFLTMETTPEGDDLHRRLGIGRADLEYNELDRFSTFVRSDFCVNSRIRKLMGDVGGLLEFAEGMYSDEFRVAKAGDLLSYLGVKELAVV